MIEDKLDQDQRIRLECVNQAATYAARTGVSNAETIVRDAVAFEKYVEHRVLWAGPIDDLLGTAGYPEHWHHTLPEGTWVSVVVIQPGPGTKEKDEAPSA